MRPEDYLKAQYRDYKVLFIHEVRQEYIDLVIKSVGKKFIVTSKLFYEYMIGRTDLQAELKLYDPSYFKKSISDNSVTSKLFYECNIEKKDLQAELELYDPSYFILDKLELRDVRLIIKEDDPADLIVEKIIKEKPKEIIYFQREICANHHHSELTECEFLCNIYGIKFTRTSQLLEYLLHEK